MTYRQKTEAPFGDRRYAVNRQSGVDIKVNSAAPLTSLDLMAEVDAYLDKSGMGRVEFSRRVFGYACALSDMSGRKRQIPKPETVEKVRSFIAENADLRVDRKNNGQISGSDLADELEAFIAEHGLLRTRVSQAAFGCSSGIASLRRFKFPKPKTIERARSFLANPGPLDALRPSARKSPNRRKADSAVARRTREIFSASRAQAMKRIEKGLPIGDVKDVPVRVRVAQMQLESELKEKARLACPIEQAKTLLRRRYPMVVTAEIVGGPKGKFVVGNRTVDEKELLAMAERLAA